MQKYFIFFLAACDFVGQWLFREWGRGSINYGISFGMSELWGLRLSLFAYLLFAIWFLGKKLRKGKGEMAIMMIALGGGVNIVARLVWGGVWDYICLPLLPFCFNLSDVLICAGVLSYILGLNGNRDTV